MPLRIGCDLDGTLADFEAGIRREAERLFTLSAVPSVPVPCSPPRATLNAKQTRQLWRHLRHMDDFWLSLREIEAGAVARLGMLAAVHGWEVIFFTQRPDSAGDTAQRQTQRWLHAHGFEWPSVYVVNGSRGRIADALALDVVLDDRPENCLDVVTDSKARAMLVWRATDAPVPPATGRLGIEPVASVYDALERLERLTTESARRTLATRLRNALRLDSDPT